MSGVMLEPDKATEGTLALLRQCKSSVMLRQSNAHERTRTVTMQLRHMGESKNDVKDNMRKQY